MSETQQPERAFNLETVYLKDSSFEAPNTPHVFEYEWNPVLDFNLQSKYQELAPGLHEVVLQATVTVKLPMPKSDDKANETTDNKDSDEKEETIVAFLAEVHESGIFVVRGFNDQEKDHLLNSVCPGMIYPYLRESISNLVNRGGFPKLFLPVVNFDALYLQEQQKRQAAEQTAEA